VPSPFEKLGDLCECYGIADQNNDKTLQVTIAESYYCG